MSKRCCPWSDGTPQRKTCVKDGAAAGEADRKAVYGENAFGSEDFLFAVCSMRAEAEVTGNLCLFSSSFSQYGT